MDPNILEAARFIGGWALDPVLRFFGIQVKDERWLKNLGLIFIAVIVGSSVIISTNALLILAVRKNPSFTIFFTN